MNRLMILEKTYSTETVGDLKPRKFPGRDTIMNAKFLGK